MITAGDIKLVKSAVMSDVPEGGGAPSGTVINDATTNSIFPDISELDRAIGRVNLRKVFAKVRTPDTEGYYGVNVIVAEPFEDPRVSATLFVGETFDRRDDASSRMEAYLSMGTTYSGLLFGNHLAGQSVVTLLQRVEATLPVVGQTLVLVKNVGLSNEFRQYVRLTSITATVRNFTDERGDFSRMQVVCDISDQLQEDFNGFDASRYDTSVNYTGKTRINETVVADAGRYCGVVALEEEVGVGDFTVQAEGIFTQLVPSTRIEVPIADSRLNQQSATLVAAGDTFNRTLVSVFTTTQGVFVGGGILPGSLSISRGGITLIDKGGVLINETTTAQVGLVDYANGALTLSTDIFGTDSGTHTVAYTPAAAPILVTDSTSLPVTAESQRLSYALTMEPVPLRNTLRVSYRAQGQWYELVEDGAGAIRGSDSSLGAGTINFSTGTITLTLGALPDVGSALIFTYTASLVSRPINALTPGGPALGRAFGKPVSLNKAIKPGTLSITWNDGTARTATDAGGVLTGAASGTVNYATGEIDFRPNLLPAVGTSVTITTTETTQAEHTVASFTDGGANWTATIPTPIKAGSVELAINARYSPPVPSAESAFDLYSSGVDRGAPVPVTVRVFDDGAGSLKIANISSNDTIGTIDYGTGAVAITKTFGGYRVDMPQSRRETVPLGIYSRVRVVNYGYVVQTVPLTILNGAGAADALVATYSGADDSALSYPFTLDEIFLPGNAGGAFAVEGASVPIAALQLGANYYAVRDGDNAVVLNPSPTTGLGTVVGARAVVGSMSGILLTDWVAGGTSAPSAIAGASQPLVAGVGSVLSVTEANFRTAIAPLVNSGFQIAGNWTNGGAGFTATANSAGLILTAGAVSGETPGSLGVVGLVDYEMGLVQVFFGKRVPGSMATDATVVDLSYMGIAGVSYFDVYAVQADTLRYNATGYSYLPLDPDILGLDPVRLPADGRVPIFRPGTVAVLGHTGIVGPAAVTNGQTVSAGRTRLSRVRVIGNDGQVIDTGYTADLDAGTVTFTSVTGYSQPVTVEHRVEDTVLVSQAQITGRISFTRPATHVYPVPGSYISSALVAGDVQARVQPAFDQVTWTGVWADAPIGSAATGTFNDTLHPITTTNLGALTERWAVRFTNSTSFEVFGEHVGVIATGNTGTDCAPMNPTTSQPYFTIPSAGWGLGWATGNVVRFNTVGAEVPIWIARTILQGPETVEEDNFTVLVRGDVDRP